MLMIEAYLNRLSLPETNNFYPSMKDLLIKVVSGKWNCRNNAVYDVGQTLFNVLNK